MDIASSFLEEALQIYNRGSNYFSALHLAGAAEEILGKFLKKTGLSTSLESE